MPVATQGTVKAMTTEEVWEIGYRLILANTYHLYLRPGTEVLRKAGGLHGLMRWEGALLTDSGGYQVFSLSAIRKISDDGVMIRSYIDGSPHHFTPEKVLDIQRAIGSDIAMVLDVCPPSGAPRAEVARAVDLTVSWAARSAKSREGIPLVFGIVQGGPYDDLRRRCAEQICAIGFDGYAIGGVSVGEPPAEAYRVVELTAPLLPEDRPRYLMGMGTPLDILNGIQRGVDLFDCVLPTRLGRNGSVYTSRGRLNLKNARFADDMGPVDPDCGCPVCAKYSAAYLRHLYKAEEILAARLATMHNLWLYHDLVRRAREAVRQGEFVAFKTSVEEAMMSGEGAEAGG
jgi:queuine tRNA-ribosyltransferase